MKKEELKQLRTKILAASKAGRYGSRSIITEIANETGYSKTAIQYLLSGSVKRLRPHHLAALEKAKKAIKRHNSEGAD